MPRYIDAEKLKAHYSWWECTESGNEQKKVFDTIIDLQPTADEEKIATEYCMKRCLVMMTMDTYEKLIACYNRCAGLRGERKTEDMPRVIGTSPTEHLVRCKERREDAET